jgi:flagellar hook-length control protein FliK
MDLQKVAIQANGNASQSGQRSENGAAAGAKTGLPFADMIRLPLIGISDLFTNLGQPSAVLDDPSDDYRQNDSEDRRPSDEAISRKDAPDNAQRDDNARADEPREDRVEKASSRDENSHEDNEPADRQEKQSADDDTPSDDPAKDQADDTDAPAADATDEDSDTDTTVAAETTRSDTAETAGSNNAGFEPALAGLVGAAQATDQGQTVKDAAQVVKDVVAGPKAAVVADTPQQQMAAGNTGADQDLDGAPQQALRQVARQGLAQSNHAAEAANKPVDQTLAQQQAKMLSDSLKSDKPVKVTVNTENRAAVAVSQPSQTLSANALAAQNNEGTNQGTTNAQASTRPAQFQAAMNNSANQHGAQAQAQAQVATQASEVAVASAGERGIARAIGQSTAGQHGTAGGTEASSGNTATTPGAQAQQTAATQKPQAAQAPRAAQQPQQLAQQISVNITKAIAEGMDRISIQLRPSELGRVEVKLEVGQNGRVAAQIIADRPEALEALRNDSRALEKALQDAGLQANAGDLSFSLRDQQENPDDSDSDNRLAGDEEGQEDGDLEAELATRILNNDLDGFVSDTRVDIRA